MLCSFPVLNGKIDVMYEDGEEEYIMLDERTYENEECNIKTGVFSSFFDATMLTTQSILNARHTMIQCLRAFS